MADKKAYATKTIAMKKGNDTILVSEQREAHYKKYGYERIGKDNAKTYSTEKKTDI